MNSFDIMDALTDMEDDVLRRAEADPPKRRILTRAFRYAAVACLPLLLILTAWFATDTTAADPYLRWTVRYREREITYLLKSDVIHTEPLPDYAPTWLPERYGCAEEILRDSTNRYLIYRNPYDTQDNLSFDSTQISGCLIHHFSNIPAGSYTQEDVTINELPGTLYLRTDGRGGGILVWIDRKECIMFTLSFSSNDPAEALRIAESVKRAD